LKRISSAALMIAAFSLIIFGKESLLTAQQSIAGQQQKIVEVMGAFFAAAHDDNLLKFHKHGRAGFLRF
jgi:hypothetical protein